MFNKRFFSSKKVDHIVEKPTVLSFSTLVCPPSGLPYVAISRFDLKSFYSLCLQTKINGKYKQWNGKHTTETSLQIQLITSLHQISFSLSFFKLCYHIGSDFKLHFIGGNSILVAVKPR